VLALASAARGRSFIATTSSGLNPRRIFSHLPRLGPADRRRRTSHHQADIWGSKGPASRMGDPPIGGGPPGNGAQPSHGLNHGRTRFFDGRLQRTVFQKEAGSIDGGRSQTTIAPPRDVPAFDTSRKIAAMQGFLCSVTRLRFRYDPLFFGTHDLHLRRGVLQLVARRVHDSRLIPAVSRFNASRLPPTRSAGSGPAAPKIGQRHHRAVLRLGADQTDRGQPGPGDLTSTRSESLAGRARAATAPE